MNPKQEQFLLFRIRAFQDHGAFHSIVNTYGQRLQTYLLVRLPSQTDADDAYSEIWLRMWNYSCSTQIESCAGVIFTIARSVVADFYRARERKQEEFSVSEGEDYRFPDTTHESIIDKIDVKLLREFINKLKEEQAQVMILRYIEGYRVKDIASQIGKTEMAVTHIIRRAIDNLRKMISEKFEQV